MKGGYTQSPERVHAPVTLSDKVYGSPPAQYGPHACLKTGKVPVPITPVTPKGPGTLGLLTVETT